MPRAKKTTIKDETADTPKVKRARKPRKPKVKKEAAPQLSRIEEIKPEVMKIQPEPNKVTAEYFAPLRPMSERTKKEHNPLLLIGLTLAIVIAYFAIQGQGPLPIINTGSDSVLDKVAKHIIISPEEEPEITDIVIDEETELQEVLGGAKNGDKLIKFSDKVIVYDETNDIIVNVAPIYTEEKTKEEQYYFTPETQEEMEAMMTEPIVVKVLNGGAPAGSAGSAAEKIKALGNFEIIDVTNAGRFYDEGVLVNLTGRDISVLEKLYEKIAVTELPYGEAPAEGVDVIVILGSR